MSGKVWLMALPILFAACASPPPAESPVPDPTPGTPAEITIQAELKGFGPGAEVLVGSGRRVPIAWHQARYQNRPWPTSPAHRGTVAIDWAPAEIREGRLSRAGVPADGALQLVVRDGERIAWRDLSHDAIDGVILDAGIIEPAALAPLDIVFSSSPGGDHQITVDPKGPHSEQQLQDAALIAVADPHLGALLTGVRGVPIESRIQRLSERLPAGQWPLRVASADSWYELEFMTETGGVTQHTHRAPEPATDREVAEDLSPYCQDYGNWTTDGSYTGVPDADLFGVNIGVFRFDGSWIQLDSNEYSPINPTTLRCSTSNCKTYGSSRILTGGDEQLILVAVQYSPFLAGLWADEVTRNTQFAFQTTVGEGMGYTYDAVNIVLLDIDGAPVTNATVQFAPLLSGPDPHDEITDGNGMIQIHCINTVDENFAGGIPAFYIDENSDQIFDNVCDQLDNWDPDRTVGCLSIQMEQDSDLGTRQGICNVLGDDCPLP